MTRKTKRSLESAIEELREDSAGDDHEADLYDLTEEEKEHIDEMFADVDREEPDQWYGEDGELTREAKHYLDAAFDAEPET